MKQSIKIILPIDIRDYIEKLFFETNAIKNVLRYIMLSSTEIDKKYIDIYQVKAENKQMEYNIALEQISKKYKPIELNNNYTFKIFFDECFIEYYFED